LSFFEKLCLCALGALTAARGDTCSAISGFHAVS
jgi:hypothetical protein